MIKRYNVNDKQKLIEEEKNWFSFFNAMINPIDLPFHFFDQLNNKNNNIKIIII